MGGIFVPRVTVFEAVGATLAVGTRLQQYFGYLLFNIYVVNG